MELLTDTICAIATPVGEAGIGIIRLSGPQALDVARKIFSHKDPGLHLQSHTLHHGWIVDPDANEPIDEVLLSFMAAPRTYTGEDVVEINCHSGYAVLNRVLGLVIGSGARLAQPGEFTRRAFLNGRIDLSQAEAVIDTIRTRSEQGLLLANRHLRGDFRQLVENWLEILEQAQSRLDALLDFCEDIPEETAREPHLYDSLLEALAVGVKQPLRAALNRFEEGRVLREGLTFVLVGKPNVGKSSMLNALLGKERAIVTALPGTTRDVIEDTLLLGGVQVRVFDTAGIRAEPDEIESRGIEMTIRSLTQADVALWLLDHGRPISEEDQSVYEAIAKKPCVVLLNKSDLPPAFPAQSLNERFPGLGPALSLSAINPSDIEGLKARLAHSYVRTPVNNCGSQIVPNTRQKECLECALDSILTAEALLRSNSYGELISFELGSARQHLEAIVGRAHDVELLDRIFLQFCVGK
ncbi:MAG: tRNA uridine-5-carboxymethylaminomethyl(34) synthesis GTPase MnmE [Syntrophobacteraceae bacterium]|nr:tRNA uridine-5-carboxymethylaminomethyl(34) synthesis GTPase MnmE [Syntrophobacteraceae bacterium]